MRRNGTPPVVRFPSNLACSHFSEGKQWHAPRKAFRPTAGLTSYEKRTQERVAIAAMKAKEKELKEEREEERQVRHPVTRAGFAKRS